MLRVRKLSYLLLLLFAPLVKAQDWQRSEYIVDSFISIALNNEYMQGLQRVRKWSSAGITYRYVHQVADVALHERLVQAHLEQLQSITGLPIREASRDASADLTIIFSSERSLLMDLQQFFHLPTAQERAYFFKHGLCLGHFSLASSGFIAQAAVIIPVDRARKRGKLLACVVEELTQVLGLPNDANTVRPSVFNDLSAHSLLTGLDYVLLKILYDSRLPVGADLSRAVPLVHTIVDDFKRTGLITNAEQQVRSGKLYTLLPH